MREGRIINEILDHSEVENCHSPHVPMKSQPFQAEVRKYLCRDRKADVRGRGAEKSCRDLCNQRGLL